MAIQVRVDTVAADLAKKLANNEVNDECIEAHFEAAREAWPGTADQKSRPNLPKSR